MDKKNHTPRRLVAALMSALLLGSALASSLATTASATDVSENSSSVSTEAESEETALLTTADEEEDDSIDSESASSLSVAMEQSLNNGERTKELVSAQKGDIITYYVNVTNSADAACDARDVVITDPIPEGLTLVEGSISDNGTESDGVITWPTISTLAIGESKEVSFQVEVTTDAYKVEWFNVASATASNADEDDTSTYTLVIHYVDTEGNKLRDDYTTSGAAGSAYDVDSKIYNAMRIEIPLGGVVTYETYYLVGTGTYGNYTTLEGITADSDFVIGIYDSDKEITIVYQLKEEVESKTEYTGYDIAVFYVDTEGNTILHEHYDECNVRYTILADDYDSSVGYTYDESRIIYTNIGDYEIVGTGTYGNYTTENGIITDSDAVSGIIDSNKRITVVYQLRETETPEYTTIVHYVNTEGHALQADYITTGDADSAYDMTEYKAETIGDYTIVGTGTYGNYTTTEGVDDANDIISGTLDSNKYIVIVYESETSTTPSENQNTVIVHYVDTEGYTLAADVVQVDETGAEYDVSTLIPETIGDYEIVGTGEYGNYTTTNGITADSDATSGTLDTDKEITAVYQKRITVQSNEVPGEVKEPNLTIAKYQAQNNGEFTDSVLSVDAGNVVTYKLVVTNTEDAGADAENVVVTDQLPDGLSLVENSISDNGSETDGIISWAIDSLAIGESVELTFQAAVPESAANTTYTNIAYVSADNASDTNTPTSSNQVDAVVGEPNILVAKYQAVNDGEKTQELQQVLPGDVVTYYIQVSNPSVEGESTGAANNVTITDAIPDNLTLVEGSISDNGTETDGAITWAIDTIPVDGTVEVSFQVTVPTVAEATSYTNIGIVTVPNSENTPIETNKVVVEETIPDVAIVDVAVAETQTVTGSEAITDQETVESSPELSISKSQSVNNGTKTTSQVTVVANDVITYYVTVTNDEDSPVAASNVVITDDIPSGQALVEGSISNDGVEDEGTIVWTIDTLDVGESVTVSFQVTVPSVSKSKTYTNVAQFTSSTQNDPVESNKVVAKMSVESVNTGDNTSFLVFGAFAAVLVLAGGCVVYLVKRRKHNKD